MGADKVSFSYYRHPVAISVTPNEVLGHSHTTLTITGRDLMQNLPLAASMSEYATACSVPTDALAHCTFNPYIHTGTFRLRLGFNSKDRNDTLQICLFHMEE
jgi:hypothetical protein